MDAQSEVLMAIIIAEIGNCHFGDIERFKQLIRDCKNAGADIIKSQAFHAEDLINIGSMSQNFYTQCELSE